VESFTTKPAPITPARKNRRPQNGFTLIEVIVALALVSVLGIVATGFLVPLKITRQSAAETQAMTYAHSYLETLKTKWLTTAEYQGMTQPSLSTDNPTPAIPDLTVDTGWTITANTGDWTAAQTLRTIKVTVTPPNSGTPVVITTKVAAP
jgi:prepilin-type N-terminal cleavage/methylation domain-containing protein